mmetsp:Transcript_1136/g.2138  ORF Transcript_1136/g.2138 Transcript_1136/m.2138 type:complete len:274 (+) Transcript_1136:1012-1833(+)
MTKVEEIYQKYSENFKMYLVCECCYEPQESAPWPVTVSKEKEEGKKILPKLLLLARRTLTAAAVVSTAAKVCKLVGLPVPQINSDMDQAKNIVNKLVQKSSVEEFDCVKRVLEGDSTQEKQLKQTGVDLRQFKEFLDNKDPKRNWGNLKLAVLHGGCATAWVCGSCADKLSDGERTNPAGLESKDCPGPSPSMPDRPGAEPAQGPAIKMTHSSSAAHAASDTVQAELKQMKSLQEHLVQQQQELMQLVLDQQQQLRVNTSTEDRVKSGTCVVC